VVTVVALASVDQVLDLNDAICQGHKRFQSSNYGHVDSNSTFTCARLSLNLISKYSFVKRGT
jgi:hypothetical protein